MIAKEMVDNAFKKAEAADRKEKSTKRKIKAARNRIVKERESLLSADPTRGADFERGVVLGQEWGIALKEWEFALKNKEIADKAWEIEQFTRSNPDKQMNKG